jgi:hypothetical protein
MACSLILLLNGTIKHKILVSLTHQGKGQGCHDASLYSFSGSKCCRNQIEHCHTHDGFIRILSNYTDSANSGWGHNKVAQRNQARSLFKSDNT